ncbi:MAG: DUF3426 domain-containing protein [Gemmatimonadetes bacterium]|nr:DUF3426 domain-containing protein [Gemmatimonadota bacterium]
MKQLALAGLGTALLLGIARPASAQGFNIYLPPDCDLDQTHFLVRNASLYVKAATESRSEDQKARSIEDAKRVLNDALDGGEEANAGVWYFLARAYALDHDLQGADSAFTRAQDLFPKCADDIDTHRRFAWVPLFNEGIEAMQNDNLALAQRVLTEANYIAHTEPNIPYLLGSVLASAGDSEQAIELFKRTVAMAMREGEYEESYTTSFFNVARLYQATEQYDSAAAWYVAYRELQPDDFESLTGLAQSLDRSGQIERALPYYDSVLARSSELSSLEVFGIGVSMFRAKHYADAARAFTLGLDQNPFFRDGWYNLTQSYFAIANPEDERTEEAQAKKPELSPEEREVRQGASAEMLKSAKELVRLDPLNEDVNRLLAAAFQLNEELDSTLAVVQRIDSLQFDVSVERFEATATGYRLEGTISNLKEETIAVPELVFEFVDADGNVIVTQVQTASSLRSGRRQRFRMSPRGEGIEGWRYHTES